MLGARLLATALLAPKKPKRTVVRDGIVWELDLREGIDLAIYVFGAFQRRVIEVISNELNLGNTFIDIGANRGAIAVPVAYRNPSCRVVAIEPAQIRFRELQKCIELNQQSLQKLSISQVFLSDVSHSFLPEQISASWHLYRFRTEGDSIGAVGCTTSGAKLSTLDDFVISEGIDRVHVLKLDVDGNEESVLLGSLQVLQRFRPTIVLEWAPSVTVERGGSLHAVVDFLASFGYIPMVINRRSLCPVEWSKLVAWQSSSGSVDLVLRSR